MNLRNTTEALPHWTTDKNVKLFKRHGNFTKEETWGRAEVLYEGYINQVAMEADTLIRMVDTGIIPAITKDLKTYEGGFNVGGPRKKLYGDLVQAQEALRVAYEGLAHAAEGIDALVSPSGVTADVPDSTDDELNLDEVDQESADKPSERPPLAQPTKKDDKKDDPDERLKPLRAEANHLLKVVLPKMNELRAFCDKAEQFCEESLWPFPSYLDILFGHHFDGIAQGNQQPKLALSEGGS